MFVVVTVLCCYLGWESSVVRQRQALLKELNAKPAFQITTAKGWAQQLPLGKPAASVPLLRVLLGDEAIQEIGYRRNLPGYSERELSRLKVRFPEATVHEVQELLLEPCHPGCFPRGTLVDTPEGPRPIESMQPGDSLTAIPPSGEAVTVQVQSVFVTDNRLWKVETDDGDLLTTQTQPLCLSDGTVQSAGELEASDTILRRRDGVIQSVEGLRVSPTERIEKVFNLVLGNSEVFVAGGFLARSKPPPTLAAR